jgi:DnaJ-class molecular chaperone
MPRSLDEAREVLNVNSGTKTETVKKVVDALRRVWHPDLGTDEEDCKRRHIKTQQINVAWDIISGRRSASRS